jgi:hypothetical protein
VTATQMKGACKKMKVHRTPLEYMITEDDVDMIAQMVQDCTSKEFETIGCHRERIQEELVDI